MEKIKSLYEKYREIINYLIFGVLTTIVNIGTKYALLFTIFDAKNAVELQLAIIISWILEFVNSFFQKSCTKVWINFCAL